MGDLIEKDEDVKDEVIEETNSQETTKEKSEEELLSDLDDGLASLFQDEEDDNHDDNHDEPQEKNADGEEPEAATKAEAEEQEEIPAEQVDIARQLGYSDEEIIKLAESSPQVLENMVTRFAQNKAAQEQGAKILDEPQVVEPEKPFELPGLDKLTPEMQAIMTPLIEKVKTQDEELSRFRKVEIQSIQEREAERARKIDSFFDGIQSDLPDVGTSANLSDSNIQTRKEIYGIAYMLQQSRGMSHEAAMNEAAYMWALSKYDVDTLEKRAEEKVVSSLNKNKKRFTARPGGQKSEKKYNSVEEKMLDTLEKGMKELFN